MKILFLCFISFVLQAQNSWYTEKGKVTIPFELSNNLIILDMKINNTKFKMILDSGAEKNMLFSFPEEGGFAVSNLRKIKLLGMGIGDTLQAYLSTNNKAQIKAIEHTNFEVLLVADEHINIVNKLGIPVNGIVGSSFFKDFFIFIDYEKSKIYVYPKVNKSLLRKLKKFQTIPLVLHNDIPYVSLKTRINQELLSVKLLFDTGLSDGLWLFESHQISSNTNYFIDVLGKGLSGDIFGKKSRVDQLYLNQFELKDALVSYPDTNYIVNKQKVIERNGSLGGEVIKRFNWVFDYSNQRAYYQKNANFDLPFHYNMSGISVQHVGNQMISEVIDFNRSFTKGNAYEHTFDEENKKYNYRYEFQPLFEIYSVRENSPADRVGIKPGDMLLSINGKKSKYYDIQKITDLFQSEEGKLITIEVDRKGKILKFKFKLEKIL